LIVALDIIEKGNNRRKELGISRRMTTTGIQQTTNNKQQTTNNKQQTAENNNNK
jgi:hypothetical protein